MAQKDDPGRHSGPAVGPDSPAIILLAAGQGRRLGQSKPLAQLEGRSLIEHAISRLRPLSTELVVVLGCQALRVRLRCRVQPHRWVVNHDWREGQSTSLQAGLRSLGAGGRGALVCLVDQPAVPTEHYAALMEQARLEPGRVAATHAGGKPMVPAYLPRALWPALFGLRGDQGAKAVLGDLGAPQIIDCEAALDDIDTPDDLERHRRRLDPLSEQG